MTKFGHRFQRCPRAWLRDEGAKVEDYIRDVGFFRAHGVMPEAGGLLDQHPRFLEAAEIIADEQSRVDAALVKIGGLRG